MVQLSLRCDSFQAFGIALVTLFLCLNRVRSSPCGAVEIRKALLIFLSYTIVVGR